MFVCKLYILIFVWFCTPKCQNQMLVSLQNYCVLITSSLLHFLEYRYYNLFCEKSCKLYTCPGASMFHLTDLHLTTQRFLISFTVSCGRSKADFWECGHQVLPLPPPQCHSVTGYNRICLTVAPSQKWILYHSIFGHQPEQLSQDASEGTKQTTIKGSVVHISMIGISCTDCQPWHWMEKFFVVSHFPFLIPSVLLPNILCRSVFPDTCSSVTDHFPNRHKPVCKSKFLLDINSFFIAYNKVYLQWTHAYCPVVTKTRRVHALSGDGTIQETTDC